VALALRDAGAEVFYTGLRKSPEYIARVAAQEDVDAVGLSILSGSHIELVHATRAALAGEGAHETVLFVGGTIPRGDWPALEAAGCACVFDAEMSLSEIVAAVAARLADAAA
jgi:methylmalonyl-CoA mutase C-terminal domain/subunit